MRPMRSRTVKAALASSIDYIDTAGWYGDGESERRIGLALKEIGGLPQGAILQTKIGRPPGDGDFSGETIKRRFERSFDLLGVDHVDTVFLHGPDMTTFDEAMAPGGPVEVLQGYKEQGLFDHFGVASDKSDVDLHYLQTGLFDAVISANRFTSVEHQFERSLFLCIRARHRGAERRPIWSGILSRGPKDYPRYSYRTAPPHLIERAEQIKSICARYGIPLASAALQFSLRDPRITVTIAGMSRPERIQRTIELASIEIPDEIWAEIEMLSPPDAVDPATY